MHLIIHLAIGETILTKRKIIISFFKLFNIISDVKPLKVLDCQYRLLNILFFKLVFFTKLDSKALIIAFLLIFWHKLYYFKCY